MNSKSSFPPDQHASGQSPGGTGTTNHQECASGQSGPTNPVPGDVAAECRRLQEEVTRLEQERDFYRERFEHIQAEFKDLHRAVTSELRKQYTEDQLRDFAELPEETRCAPLADFLPELEAIVRGPKHE